MAGLAKEIVQEQSPSRYARGGGWIMGQSEPQHCFYVCCGRLARVSLLLARAKLYELLVNCIPADVIIKALMKELMPRLDSEVKHELAHWAAHYEHRLRLGQKEIFHLEAFIAKFMAVYKGWLIRSFGSMS